MITHNICFNREIRKIYMCGYVSYLAVCIFLLVRLKYSSKMDVSGRDLTLVMLNKLRCHTHF